MRAIQTIFCSLVIYSLAAFAQASEVVDYKTQVTAEIKQVAKRIMKNLETVNYQDTLEHIYSKDGLLMVADTYMIEGWDGVAAALVAGNVAVEWVKIDKVEAEQVVVLSPEQAIHTILFYETVLNGDKTEYKKVAWSHTFTKQNGQWKAVHSSAAHLYLDGPYTE